MNEPPAVMWLLRVNLSLLELLCANGPPVYCSMLLYVHGSYQGTYNLTSYCEEKYFLSKFDVKFQTPVAGVFACYFDITGYSNTMHVSDVCLLSNII